MTVLIIIFIQESVGGLYYLFFFNSYGAIETIADFNGRLFYDIVEDSIGVRPSVSLASGAKALDGLVHQRIHSSLNDSADWLAVVKITETKLKSYNNE